MKRYQFRLATVLRVRRLEEEAARARLLDAGRAVTVSLAMEARAREHYLAIPVRLGPGSADDFHRDRQVKHLAAHAVRTRESDSEVAQAAAEHQRRAWVYAAGRLNVLEKLDERRREEHRSSMEREESVFLDELAARRQEDPHG